MKHLTTFKNSKINALLNNLNKTFSIGEISEDNLELVKQHSSDFYKQKLIIAFLVKENFDYFNFILKTQQILQVQKELENIYHHGTESIKTGKKNEILENLFFQLTRFQPLFVELNKNDTLLKAEKIANLILDYQYFLLSNLNSNELLQCLNLFQVCQNYIEKYHSNSKIDNDKFNEFKILDINNETFYLTGYEINELASLNSKENLNELLSNIEKLHKLVFEQEKINEILNKNFLRKTLDFSFLSSFEFNELWNDKKFDDIQNKRNKLSTKTYYNLFEIENFSLFISKVSNEQIELFIDKIFSKKEVDENNIALDLFTYHIGDCTAFPCSCEACYEWLLGLNTIWWDSIFVGDEIFNVLKNSEN